MSKAKFEEGDSVYRQKIRPRREGDRLLVAGYTDDGRVRVIASNDAPPGIFEFDEKELHLWPSPH